MVDDEADEILKSKKNRESAKSETSTKKYLILQSFYKFNPEGTNGPIWLRMVPIFLELSCHQSGVKKLVNCVILKNDLILRGRSSRRYELLLVFFFQKVIFNCHYCSRLSLKTGGIPVWVRPLLKGGPIISAQNKIPSCDGGGPSSLGISTIYESNYSVVIQTLCVSFLF